MMRWAVFPGHASWFRHKSCLRQAQSVTSTNRAGGLGRKA
jgi:hypothetical protein